MLFEAIFGVVIGVASAAIWSFITKIANPKKPDDAALKLLDIAVKLLPAHERDEAREQWLADLIDFPEPPQRYRHASTLWLAAIKLRSSAISEACIQKVISFSVAPSSREIFYAFGFVVGRLARGLKTFANQTRENLNRGIEEDDW